jgi:hypothetical protein
MAACERVGREASLSVAILDSQSVRAADQAGLALLSRRRVVERTFARIVKNRRFGRDDEQPTHGSRRDPDHHRRRRSPHAAVDLNSPPLLKHTLKWCIR